MAILLIIALWTLGGYIGLLLMTPFGGNLFFLPWQFVVVLGPTIIGLAAFLYAVSVFDWLRKRL